MRPAPLTNKNMSATEMTAKELTSPGRRSEADHVNGSITVGDQSREDVSSPIEELLTPKRRTPVGLRNA